MRPKLARALTIVLIALTVLALPVDARERDRKPEPDFTLTILHNNDGESQLLHAGVGLEDFGGVARFKTVIDKLRREAEAGPGRSGGSRNDDDRPSAINLFNDLREYADKGRERDERRDDDDDRGSKTKQATILLSSGDNFLAGPELNASFEKGPIFYDTIAMALFGYDAAAIGNHEFDFGPDVLAQFICGFLVESKSVLTNESRYERFLAEGKPVRNCSRSEAPFPFVTANLDFSREPNLQDLVKAGAIAKSTVIEKNGEKIGIVGATTPLISFISSPRDVIIDLDYAAAIQRQIDSLQRKRIDKIIVISHLQDVNEDLALASLLRGVDVMIAGGGDELLANPDDLLVPGDVRNPDLPYPLWATGADGAKIPVVTTAGDYKYVGRLVVDFDKDGNVLSVDPGSGPVRVAGGNNPDAVKPDPTVKKLVTDPVQAYVSNLATTVIAQSEVALEGRRSPGVRTMETNLGDLMADAWLWQATQLAPSFGVGVPQVALQNGGGIRNNTLIPAGPITLLTTFDIAPFANFVSVVENVTPADFKAIAENAVAEIGGGRFGQIAGFKLVYDPNGTAQQYDADGNITVPGARVISVTLDNGTKIVECGAVVGGAPTVNFATIDFLANGGDLYPFPGNLTTLGVSYQKGLENYIVDGLGGQITAADYPEGGEGRITTGSACP